MPGEIPLDEQAHLAAEFIKAGQWKELNILFAQSPKSTDPEAQQAIDDHDTDRAEALLAQWKAQVQAEALTRSGIGGLAGRGR